MADIKHTFTSAVADGVDDTLVQPSDWNAAHTIEDGAIAEAKLSISDNTTKDVSTSAHGFAPKAPNSALQFLNGVGAWSVPGLDGWILATGTWSYSSADAPTFIASVNADMTGVLSVGMRLKLTQTTAKYFIITAVGAYSGGVTLITLYGGTDYTLADEAITVPYYSMAKAPFGFPITPVKWSVVVEDASSRSQADPTNAQWYNITQLNISLPIGVWNFGYQATLQVADPTSGVYSVFSTLSTANNSESDTALSAESYGYVLGNYSIILVVSRQTVLSLDAKTAYYFNIKTVHTGVATIYVRGDLHKSTVRAVCAYL